MCNNKHTLTHLHFERVLSLVQNQCHSCQFAGNRRQVTAHIQPYPLNNDIIKDVYSICIYMYAFGCVVVGRLVVLGLTAL